MQDAPLYRRDSVIVTPNDERRRLDTMKASSFISWAERYLICYKTRLSAQGSPYDVKRSMSKDVATNFLDSIDTRLATPEVKRTRPIPMPYILENGEMELMTPGYHPPSRSYTFPPNTPTSEPHPIQHAGLPTSHGYYDDSMSLQEAVTHLYNLHSEFPFSDWSSPFTPDYFSDDSTIQVSRSFACQIAGALSLFAAGCVPAEASRMGFLFNANSQRSGKTLLAKIIIASIYGSFKTQPWRNSDEEMEKILSSETLAASNYICFDNIRGLLASQPLEGFMTTPTWTGRILGKSEMFEADQNAVLFITGNNLNIGTDIAQRFLVVNLNIEEANVQDRTVKNVIDDVWLANPQNRHRTLSALWTLVRHWNKNNRPKATGKPYLGFELWCHTIGGIVENAGLGNILQRPELENAGDSEATDILELVTLLAKGTPAAEYTFQQVVDIMHDNEIMHWKLKGRDQYSEESQQQVYKLDHSATSAVGKTLAGYTNGEKGRLYNIPDLTNPTQPRKIRFFTRGKGRSRRYVIQEIN